MSGLKIVDGVGGLNDPAAVAISEDNDFKSWKVKGVPRREGIGLWGESSVIVDGPHITCIARHHTPDNVFLLFLRLQLLPQRHFHTNDELFHGFAVSGNQPFAESGLVVQGKLRTFPQGPAFGQKPAVCR